MVGLAQLAERLTADMTLLTWCPWCNGNTAHCGCAITGSKPVGHPKNDPGLVP